MAILSSTSKKKKKSQKSMPSPSSSQTRAKTFQFGNIFLRRRGSAIIPFSLILIAFLLYVTWRIPSSSSSSSGPNSEFYSFEIVNEYPHDPDAFTQGLVYGGNDTLLESTGLYGRSSVREVLLQTGKIKVFHHMDRSEFGEGLTLLGERLFQVTWLKNTGFIYDRTDFSKWEKFTHQMRDGWGLATDGKVLFGSDGSSTLYQLDPITGKALHKVTVKYKDQEIPYLNELEYINGEVWANVLQSDCIAKISHNDGFVHSWILLHELRNALLESGHHGIDVLNGIAWDEEENRLFVTGKLWPTLYEIKLKPVKLPSIPNIRDLCSIKSY